jgi:hypothetical protein
MTIDINNIKFRDDANYLKCAFLKEWNKPCCMPVEYWVVSNNNIIFYWRCKEHPINNNHDGFSYEKINITEEIKNKYLALRLLER